MEEYSNWRENNVPGETLKVTRIFQGICLARGILNTNMALIVLLKLSDLGQHKMVTGSLKQLKVVALFSRFLGNLNNQQVSIPSQPEGRELRGAY
jgi:hypothetical protein